MKRSRWSDLLILTLLLSGVAIGFQLQHRTKAPTSTLTSATPAVAAIAEAYRAKDYKRCMDLCARELEKGPGDLTYMRYVGMCQVQLDRPKEALKTFSSAINSVNDGIIGSVLYENRMKLLRLERARLQVSLGDFEAALQDLRTFRDIGYSEEEMQLYDSKEVPVQLLTAQCYSRRQPKLAKSVLRAVLQFEPENQEALLHQRKLDSSATSEPTRDHCEMKNCPICFPASSKDIQN